MRHALCLLLLAASPLCMAEQKEASQEIRPKKIIEWGWDEPDTKFLRDNIEAMERLPFDGLVFHVVSSRGGNLVWEMWGSRRFQLDEFEHAIDNLRATEFRRFTDRFLRVNVTPGSVDWFDDEWSVVLGNFEVAAQIAKQGSATGFMFDVEQYNEALFNYNKRKHKDTKSFADYQAKVRSRGQEWMKTVNRRFSDITILLTFGYRITRPAEGQPRQDSHYGLLADFLDGMLDACSDDTRIVDAWEYSYPYKQEKQFRQAYETVTKSSLEWSAVPEKYRRHVRAGFGIWMDCRWRQVGWNLDDFSKNHFTPDEFQYAVRFALEHSDEYVWIYTEQPRWWTNERLPEAYVAALRRARDGQQSHYLRMDFESFDQRPGRGWRLFAERGEHLAAAKLIERYLEANKELEPYQLVALTFHAGQMYAFAGETEPALRCFEQALLEQEPAGPVRWNAYVKATMAFLRRDRDKLRECRNQIAEGPKLQGKTPNLSVVDALIDNFDQPYCEAYRAHKAE